MSAKSTPDRLSEKQESRLIIHLESEFLQLTRAYEGRHSDKSTMPTISHFLDATITLLEFILRIPPSSSQLRIAHLLTLTGFLPDALSSYELKEATLPKVWSALRKFDAGWVTALNGEPFEPTSVPAASENATSQSHTTQATWTERARLSSLVTDVRSNLAVALGLPGQEGRREYNPRGQIVEPRLAPPEAPMTNGEDEEAHEMEVEAEVEEHTPSLADGTTSESMSLDTGEDLDDEDEDEDEEDFEEIDVNPSSTQTFEIHFHADAQQSRPDQSESIEAAQVQQRPGFDPDEEYGDASLDNDEDRGIVIETRQVFERTLQRLKELGIEST